MTPWTPAQLPGAGAGARKWRHWSDAEFATLAQMRRRGCTVAEIAAELDRPEGSVQMQICKRGLSRRIDPPVANESADAAKYRRRVRAIANGYCRAVIELELAELDGNVDAELEALAAFEAAERELLGLTPSAEHWPADDPLARAAAVYIRTARHHYADGRDGRIRPPEKLAASHERLMSVYSPFEGSTPSGVEVKL